MLRQSVYRKLIELNARAFYSNSSFKEINMSNSQSINVWDPVVRIGHWLLVIAFFTAYFTEDDLLTQHTWAGYTVAAIIVSRIIWGFVGTPYAKFSNFIYKPSAIIHYLKNLIARKEQHYIGHNPAAEQWSSPYYFV